MEAVCHRFDGRLMFSLGRLAAGNVLAAVVAPLLSILGVVVGPEISSTSAQETELSTLGA